MIELSHFSFAYAGGRDEGLKQIELCVGQGECVLLCGKSGCGKTTAIRAVNGLIPHFYDGIKQGRALLYGQSVEDMPMHEISGLAGTVFQNPRSQFFNVDTDSEIVFGMENLAYSRAKMEQRMQQVTEELHLHPLRRRNIFHLSGGEKQKIAFASVYAIAPDVFLLDEPSANLDAAVIEELKDMISLLKKQGKTILISEHRLYYLRDLLDRAFVLEQGEIKAVYSREEFLQLTDAEREQLGLRAFDLEQVRFGATCDNRGYNTVGQTAGIFDCGKHRPPYELAIENAAASHRKKAVWKNVRFTAVSGEIIAITGHNGAGKTTLARALCGLQKLDNGSISLNGRRLTPHKLSKLAYMVMQDVNYQLFAETVEKECAFGVKRADPHAVREALEQMGLAEFAERHPNTLSGGQKQRLAVAASLVSKKEILVFDEPTSGLDGDSMCRVASILRNLAAANKLIFVVTHDPELIASCCSHIIQLGKGGLLEDCRLDETNWPHAIYHSILQ
ncbi:ABC transporter ATP-binding protein [Paenibacillus sp. GM2]|uniref:ABC transporter ATP-binding protein n=1 Tax=Paenibacillus sp. GM2 TaxID=1622070 RepID=UPI00083877CD|nr:energy-coupling factor ABC transporter ATP-binding protein [Paenibacillus sp. GM2]